jgi:hydroxymethylpyrimidine/phosphomethylpyrimidine kinase
MRPSLLLIGHADATGHHGLAADLRAAEALDVQPLPVITSFTIGPPEAPTALVPVMGRSISRQLADALDQEPVAALVGVISRGRHVRLIARALADRGPSGLVVAPIPGSFDLAPLVNQRLFVALRKLLVPQARAVVLPALRASPLAGANGETVDELRAIGERLIGLGADAAWVRAGENLSRCVDVLVEPRGSGLLDYHPAGPGAQPHTAPASLAALLALGTKLREAVDRAHRHSYNLDRTLYPV